MKRQEMQWSHSSSLAFDCVIECLCLGKSQQSPIYSIDTKVQNIITEQIQMKGVFEPYLPIGNVHGGIIVLVAAGAWFDRS